MALPSGSGPISDGSPAPCVLPKVWPPAISATVSSSFIAMRKNVSRISFAAQPRAFGTPVQLFRLPHIGATAGESERLEAHRFEGDVTGENKQISPGQLAAVLLLDRPQQAAPLVEVRVVRPAVERREALLTCTGAATAVGDAVGAGAVPGQADEQSAVVTEIGRPPVLRVPHQGMQVLDHGVDVEALELLGIVERFAHRIGGGRFRMEHADIEVLWPPVAVPGSAGAPRERALARVIVSLCVHVVLRSYFAIFFELFWMDRGDFREASLTRYRLFSSVQNFRARPARIALRGGHRYFGRNLVSGPVELSFAPD